VADAERPERLLHVRDGAQIGGRAGGGRVAEVAPAIGIELGEAPIGAHHVVERGEGRGGAFLRPEAGVEDAAIGIVEGHDEVLHREVWEPGVGRGVEVDEHADERAPFPFAAVLPPRGRLRDQARVLQDQSGPGVGEPKPVMLDRS
jgi:hypothetical protein